VIVGILFLVGELSSVVVMGSLELGLQALFLLGCVFIVCKYTNKYTNN
jgi:hypothetical protein